MHSLPPLIKDLAIMLGIASIVILLFQKIRQPVVLGYLVAGMILGPYTPPHMFISETDDIKTLSELGVIFLMFALGLEFSFHKLMRVGVPASFTGFIEVVFMLAIGYATGHLIGWSFQDSLFLGAALAISSTTIIIKSLSELKLTTKRFAELIFGILVVEDLLAILLLVALSTIVITNNIFSTAMLWAVIKLVLVVGSWFLAGYFIVPTLIRKIMHFVSEETLTIVSVALCLLLVAAAAYFHYSTALGAFIMGSILAETPLVHRVEELIRPIKDIFAAVFFISVGMLINPTIIAEQFPIVLLISGVTIIGKLLTTSLGSLLTGQSINTSLRVGFGMAQVGEFSFIIAGLGLALNATSSNLYPIIVAVSAITTFTTPYLIRFSGHLSNNLENHLSEKTKYLLSSYAAWVYHILASAKKQSLYGKALTRLILNGIIIAIIFIMIDSLAVPELIQLNISFHIANIICWITALLLSSPFIWGMLFSFQNVSDKKNQKYSFTPLTILTWLITASEIIILSAIKFNTWIVTLLTTVITILFFSLAYKQLAKFYYWFEQRLISNLQQNNIQAVRYEELAPWDTHLVEMVVGNQSPFLDKSLTELGLREKFGVNIVAIYRNYAVIFAPRGNEKILKYDKLVVLGSDEQLEPFYLAAEKGSPQIEEPDLLKNFSLKAYFLEHNHRLIGLSIRDSQIREKYTSIVVGLERDGKRILNPDPATILQENDLLLFASKVDQTHFNTVDS